MAVNFWDPRNGFRHSEVVTFINEEVLCDGGSQAFYVDNRSHSWHQVEDQLSAMMANPMAPHALKRACAWSALAQSVRFLQQPQDFQLSKVQQLQDQLAERQATTWAVSSQLQQLRVECEGMAEQLRQVRDDLKQSIEENKVLHRQLFQTERSAYSGPQSPEIDGRLLAQRQRAEDWPHDAEEQVVFETEGALVPPQMHPRRIHNPDLWAAGRFKEEMASLWDQQHHSKAEDSVMSTFVNHSEHIWNQGDPENHHTQE